MRAAASETDFRAAPVGAYLAASRFLYFCARPDLCGFALWGRPDADDCAASSGCSPPSSRPAIDAAAGLAPVLVDLRRIPARTLQRQLGDAGATYVGEVGAAQVRAAQRLLLDSSLQITEIALEVGDRQRR